MKQVADYQNDPNRYSQIGRATSHYLPNHDASRLKLPQPRVIGYLDTMRPVTQKAAPLDAEIEPNQMQKEAYNRALDIAEQPLAVFRLAKEQRLTDQDIGHLNVMYPELVDRIRQKIMDAMTTHVGKEKPIPYHMRMSLSKIMGSPLDSSMTQSAIAGNQAMAIAASKQQAAEQKMHR